MRCAWIDFMLPTVAKDKVINVINVLAQSYSDMAAEKKALASGIGSSRKEAELDVTTSLFVSKRVAKAFPTLIESRIVRSYRSVFAGGEGAEDAPPSAQQPMSGSTSSSPFSGTVRWMAAWPIVVHEMIIRLSQPMLLGKYS
jgi:hypothetical protein